MESTITGVQTGGGLTIVQIATSDRDTFSYISCGKALAGKKLRVNEVSAAGSVNTVLVLNDSDEFVFMMDGDILSGAKQNRVVNASVLLPPHSKTSVPVSCVERGRWKNTSSGFNGTDYTAPVSMRVAKATQVSRNLKSRNEFASDQGSIWSSVASYEAAFRAASPTSNLSDIYEGNADTFSRLTAGFSAGADANGVAVFLGKHLAGVDVFNMREVYAEYFPKLLRGAAFEVSASAKSTVPPSGAEARYRTLELLDLFEKAEFSERPGVGVGTDRRFASERVTGFELACEGHLVHLAAFTHPEN